MFAELVEAARKEAKKPKLNVVSREKWDNGTVVTWADSPFRYERKPQVPSKLHDTAKPGKVPLKGLIGTQKRVTHEGVKKYKKGDHDPPLVYRSSSGKHYIAHGHHRLTAAHLRGDSHAHVHVVDIGDRDK